MQWKRRFDTVRAFVRDARPSRPDERRLQAASAREDQRDY